jgi:hypothetical protein
VDEEPAAAIHTQKGYMSRTAIQHWLLCKATVGGATTGHWATGQTAKHQKQNPE